MTAFLCLDFATGADDHAEFGLRDRPAGAASIGREHLREHRHHQGEARPSGESEKPPEPEGPSGFSGGKLADAGASRQAFGHCVAGV